MKKHEAKPEQLLLEIPTADSDTIARFSISGNTIVRTINLLGKKRNSSLKIPSWAKRNQPLDALYDLAWLAARKEPKIKKSSGEIRIVDLFCGCGGLTLGIREAARALGYSFRCAFASDIAKNALAVYRRNFQPDVADPSPIEQHIDGELGWAPTERERDFLKTTGAVDILVAGPPCQGNSDLNNFTRRDDPKNLLYLRAVRAVEILKPDSVIIENVPGVLHEAHGVLQTAIFHLSALGYSVSYGIVPMKTIGVPQNRKRMVLLASRCCIPNLESIIRNAEVPLRPISWACEDLVNAYDENSVFNSSAVHSATNQLRMQFLFKNNLYELPNSERPDCHRLKEHRYTAVYGRMHWDVPAPTITGGFGSCGQGRFVHPLRPRTLTPHEAARVQFFPDFFDFSGMLRRELQQVIGNAVPAKAGFVVAIPLLKASIESKRKSD